ncbi:MAG TPA: cysteine--tRNA ligase [Chloroflexota bacterium]|nr:cysteine--tRNA ligase [Chloroflexota bacterium]
MRIYNTLTRSPSEIVPLHPGEIRMYTCGPTVYRNIHIGNLRSFATADWLRRALEYRGLRVTMVKNITDVGHMRQEVLDRGEDKIIAQARKEGRSAAEIAAFYTAAFQADERALNILPPHVAPRATDHIPQMLGIVADLVAKGFAYEVRGNVFFDVTRFSAYGALSGNQLAQSLARDNDGEALGKRHPEDFPLWKAAEPDREMAWESPWGRGFPGWHIECSAMAIAHLGPTLDIHTGGVDNIFPHHEDEIAQSEGHTGVPFARIWVHTQHLLSDGQKMAKSTGNAYTLEDVARRGFDPMALRYLFCTVQYRSRINFTFASLRAAQTGLNRLRLALLGMREAEGRGDAGIQRGRAEYEAALDDEAGIQRCRADFEAALDNDLHLPRALAAVWELARRNPYHVSPAARRALVLDLDRVLGLGLADWLAAHSAPASAVAIEDGLEVGEQILALTADRDRARADRDYPGADRMRAAIEAAGFAVRDTAAGPYLTRRPERDVPLIARAADTPDRLTEPSTYAYSVHLLGHDSLDDLRRCVESILRHPPAGSLELVVVDNGSTDGAQEYARRLAREPSTDTHGVPVATQVFLADHNMGFGAGRNAGLRAARGEIVVVMDTSMEVTGDIWNPLATALADPGVGLVGPYALVTENLKDFQEKADGDADAMEGYLIACRRSVLLETGLFDERFRFYRLADIHLSFFCKAAGYRVGAVPEAAARLIKHPHREWFALTEEEQATRSKRNFDLFYRRWHHGQSLLAMNYNPDHHWFGHDHGHHVGGTRPHTDQELPASDQPHTHEHRHWPDHSHTHPHSHGSLTGE